MRAKRRGGPRGKRWQVVIALGEGVNGELNYRAFQEAAALRGQTLSAWARDVLSAGLQVTPVGKPQAVNLQSYVEESLNRQGERIQALERRVRHFHALLSEKGAL